jgi:hypothetical protein
MEMIVPRMKMGVFMDMAKFEMKKLGPGASRSELREAAARAWDSVDNRMGELVYDNLFWNKAVKGHRDGQHPFGRLEPGHDPRAWRRLMDFGKAGAKVLSGKPGQAEFTHRMAYTLAMPAFAAVVGGMVHRLLTGKNPDEFKDWFFPKTGEKDKDGHDVRLTLPSYMKDVLAFGKDPVKTLADKTHPMLNTIMEMLSNKDYYGTKIRNEDDSIVQQILSEAKHVGEAFQPFGIREVKQLREQGQGAKSFLPLLGIVKARRDITSSKAELLASELMADRTPPGGRTQQQADKAKLVRDLADGLKTNEPGAKDAIRTAVRAGKITESDLQEIKQHVTASGFERSVKHLDMPAAMKVWAVATPQERRKLAPILFTKLRAATGLTRDEKVAFLKQLQEDWKAVKGLTAQE